MYFYGYQGNIFYTVVDPSVPYMTQHLHSLGLGSRWEELSVQGNEVVSDHQMSFSQLATLK